MPMVASDDATKPASLGGRRHATTRPTPCLAPTPPSAQPLPADGNMAEGSMRCDVNISVCKGAAALAAISCNCSCDGCRVAL